MYRPKFKISIHFHLRYLHRGCSYMLTHWNYIENIEGVISNLSVALNTWNDFNLSSDAVQGVFLLFCSFVQLFVCLIFFPTKNAGWARIFFGSLVTFSVILCEDWSEARLQTHHHPHYSLNRHYLHRYHYHCHHYYYRHGHHRYHYHHLFVSESQRSWVQISCGPEHFSGLIFTTSSVVFITARIDSISIYSTAVHIYDFHILAVVVIIIVTIVIIITAIITVIVTVIIVIIIIKQTIYLYIYPSYQPSIHQSTYRFISLIVHLAILKSSLSCISFFFSQGLF